MNKQRGAISTAAAVTIVLVIIVLAALAYWYASSNGLMTGMSNTASTTATGTDTGGTNSQSSTVTTNPSGTKTYLNFLYGYTIEYPADAHNSVGTPESVSFGFTSGTTTPDATLKISTGLDVTHIAYCMTVPQGATNVATTTINGTAFLSYIVPTTATTYYRVLHEAPRGNTCYDIQKSAQASATLNTKLNSILQTFTFKTF